MGASASSASGGCCTSNREEELLNAPSEAISDEVVRPVAGQAGGRRPGEPLPIRGTVRSSGHLVRTLHGGSKEKKAPLASVPSDEALGSEDQAAGLSQVVQNADAPDNTDAQDGFLRHVHNQRSGGQRRPSEEKSSDPKSPWQKPKEIATSALRSLGLWKPPAEYGSSGEDFAADLLEFALTVCAASALECANLSKEASREDKRALKRLVELVARAGLSAFGSPVLGGTLTLVELAQAFLSVSAEEAQASGGQDIQESLFKFPQFRSNSSLSSFFGTGRFSNSNQDLLRSRSNSHAGGLGLPPASSSRPELLAPKAAEDIDPARSAQRRVGSKSSISVGQEDWSAADANKSRSDLAGKLHSAGELSSGGRVPGRLTGSSSRGDISRSTSALSLNNPIYQRSMSDFSSCSEFFRKRPAAVRAANLRANPSGPCFIEFLSSVENSMSGVPDGQISTKEPGKGDYSTPVVMDIQLPKSSGGGHPAACDAVFHGEGEEKEILQAEVVNFGAAGTDSAGTPANHVRIQFKSRYLRHQNEWQRQLLVQQQSLLMIASSRLKSARKEKKKAESALRQDDEVREEQKELLRGFRKIITRDLTQAEVRPSVFVVEKRDDLRAEVQELCRILDYPCQMFRNLQHAKMAVQSPPPMETTTSLSSRRPSNELLLSGRPGADADQDWRSRQLTSGSALGNTMSASSLEFQTTKLRVVLVGAAWLERGGLPEKWEAFEDVVLVLTSEAEDFENVGRMLHASGEAEIRERLRTHGISDYLLHPLSLESLQAVIAQALRRQFGDDYLLVETIGRGTSGIVHQAKRLKDGKTFALKEINTRRLSRTAKQDVERETQLLQELSWPTVVFVVDSWENVADHLRFLLMPLLQGGNLHQATEAAIGSKDGEPTPMSRERVAAWYAQTLHGLTYLHWRGVIHRDLKPGNILLAADGQSLQIGDLGSAALLPGPGPHPARRSVVRGTVCTPVYGSPEVLEEGTFMSASDIWSVGATFYEVMTLQALIPVGTSFADIKALMCAFDIDSPQSAPGSQVQNLAGKALAALRDSKMGAPAAELPELLRQDPLKRPTAATLASRPATAHRIKSVLAQGALPSTDEQKAHFELFTRVVQESEAAADLPASPQTPQEEVKKTRRRDRSQNRT